MVAQLSRSRQAVHVICKAAASDLRSPLSITQMEQLTGLTGRALRYAFYEEYNCSPLEWQRNLRLDRAREFLLSTAKLHSMKRIAFDFGFKSTQSFTRYYELRFGEHPSQTYGKPKALAGDLAALDL